MINFTDEWKCVVLVTWVQDEFLISISCAVTMRKCLPSVGRVPAGDKLLSRRYSHTSDSFPLIQETMRSVNVGGSNPRRNSVTTKLGHGGEVTVYDMYHHLIKKPTASYAVLQKINVCSISSVATGKCLLGEE